MAIIKQDYGTLGGEGMTPEIATMHTASYTYGTLIKYNNGVPTVVNRNSYESSTPNEGDYLIVDQANHKIKAKVACKCLVSLGNNTISISDYAANATIVDNTFVTNNVVMVIP